MLSGAKKIEIDKKMVNVRLSVQYMSFRLGSATIEWCMASSTDDVSISLYSAHADAKGIMQLIRQVPSILCPFEVIRLTVPPFPGCPKSCDAGPWRGCQNGLSEAEGDARVRSSLLHAR